MKTSKPRPTLAPKCRRDHPKYKRFRRECGVCHARDLSTAALRRWELREGLYENDLVDATEARNHARKLLAWGWDREEIADESGLRYPTIQRIVRGTRDRISRVTHDAIMSLEPKPYATKSNRRRVCGTGAARKLQGLQAQGWTTIYMAGLIGCNHSRIGQLARSQRGMFVRQETIDWVNTLVDKLGAYDITELETPMDGMSRITADRAARNGWVVLGDWDGLDIEDPRVNPHGFDPALAAAAGDLVVIDPYKVSAALRIDPTYHWDAEGREHVDVFPFTHTMNKAEAHEVVRLGSDRGNRHRGHRGQNRFSANVLAQRLVVSERAILRMRRANLEADAVLDGCPALAAALHAVHLILTCEEWNWPLRLRAAAAVLSAYPIDKSFRVFRDRLTILRATQPSPHGLGWTDAELAAWLGTTEEEATALRLRAVIAATQPQKTLNHWTDRNQKTVATRAQSAAVA